VHRGELVIHEDQARAVKEVFRALFKERFPVKRMQLVDVYGGDDDRSMAANNTSGFNCRPVEGSSSWSEHAYGRAIDINPIQNPEVRDQRVSPPAGARYLERSRRAPGLIRADDMVVRAFASIGWGWGGYWTSLKDYQHFSSSGR
jgi:D-alanyl-D-alanine carboxypeptidase-like protein